MNPMGGIVMTNDGNAILREIQVQHPAAKTMIEISRTQDEEVGDGTTSVIILGEKNFTPSLGCHDLIFFFSSRILIHQYGTSVSAGEMMSVAEQFLEQQMHPTVVIGAYRQALEDILKIMKEEIR